MTLKNYYFTAFVLLLIMSCKKDDDNGAVTIPPQSLSETEAENDAEIVAFLKTHFYNYDEFANPPEGFDYKIVFDTIAGDNADKTSLYNSGSLPGVEFITQIINVDASSLGLSTGETQDHKLYILIARQGLGGKPTIGDNSILRYEGQLLNGKLFDASSRQPVKFYLADPGLRIGFAQAMLKLETSGENIINVDGTVSYINYGVGVAFMPSGLAYFNSATATIPAYSPLIFKLDAISYEPDTDYDKDGIPSIQEDINKNGNLNDDNTDVDTEFTANRLPNHADPDDDGDGKPTSEEILIDGVIKKDSNGKIIFPDSDGDGTPDHLDKD